MKPVLLIPALIAALLLPTGCGRLGDEAAPVTTDELAFAEQWQAGVAADDPVLDGWLASFDDQRLQALVDEALAHNSDLRAAIAQVTEARARAQRAGAELSPTVNAALGGSRADSGSGANNQVTAGLTFEWELDVWGRLETGARAATLDLVAAEADLRGARQALAGAVANAWFLAITAQQLVELSQQTTDTYASTLAAVQARVAAGMDQPMDLELARAQLSTAESTLAEATGAFEDAVRSLETLVGRYPGAELEVVDALPELPPTPPAGLPSSLLERRPDVVAADRRVAAAFQLTESSRAAQMPRIAITASGGPTGSDFSEALNPANAIWNLGGNLLAPIFDGGRRELDVEISEAQQEQALANYVSVARNAFEEVERALAAEEVVRQRLGFLGSSTADLTKAAEIARKQYDAGLTDVLSVNQVERQRYQSEQQLTALHGTQLQQRVVLYLSLGGDFSVPPEPPIESAPVPVGALAE